MMRSGREQIRNSNCHNKVEQLVQWIRASSSGAGDSHGILADQQGADNVEGLAQGGDLFDAPSQQDAVEHRKHEEEDNDDEPQVT